MKRQNADTLGGGIFLVGLGILFLVNWIWPGILLLIGLVAFVNQALKGEVLNGMVSLILFGGAAMLFAFSFDTRYILPAGLIIAGLLALANNFFRRNLSRRGRRCKKAAARLCEGAHAPEAISISPPAGGGAMLRLPSFDNAPSQETAYNLGSPATPQSTCRSRLRHSRRSSAPPAPLTRNLSPSRRPRTAGDGDAMHR